MGGQKGLKATDAWMRPSRVKRGQTRQRLHGENGGGPRLEEASECRTGVKGSEAPRGPWRVKKGQTRQRRHGGGRGGGPRVEEALEGQKGSDALKASRGERGGRTLEGEAASRASKAPAAGGWNIDIFRPPKTNPKSEQACVFHKLAAIQNLDGDPPGRHPRGILLGTPLGGPRGRPPWGICPGGRLGDLPRTPLGDPPWESYWGSPLGVPGGIPLRAQGNPQSSNLQSSASLAGWM